MGDLFLQTIATIILMDCLRNLLKRRWTSLFVAGVLKKISNKHALYNAFFKFEKGPPPTSFELNGWEDDLIHD